MKITALRAPTGGEADQLAIYKRGQKVELGVTENNSSLCFERDLNPGPLDFKSGALTTLPRCLPCSVAEWPCSYANYIDMATFLLQPDIYGYLPDIYGSNGVPLF